jgi:hypothetical protein
LLGKVIITVQPLYYGHLCRVSEIQPQQEINILMDHPMHSNIYMMDSDPIESYALT